MTEHPDDYVLITRRQLMATLELLRREFERAGVQPAALAVGETMSKIIAARNEKAKRSGDEWRL